jgi:hypothetical protein
MSTELGVHTLHISRRNFLRSATLVAGAGVVFSAIAVTPAMAGAKFSQKAALYQPTPKGAQNCGNCVQFQPDTACKVVDGSVAAAGWCMLYSPKK